MRARSLLLGHVKVKSGLHLDGRHNILLEPLILTKRGGLECVQSRTAHMALAMTIGNGVVGMRRFVSHMTR